MADNLRSTEAESGVYQYLAELYPSEPNLHFEKAKLAAQELGLARISISPVEGRLLSLAVALNQCRNFVEIGTLTGYSALWILQALAATGKLYCLEKDPKHGQVAREILKFDTRAEVMIGDALQVLPELSGKGPFDGVFIDANKSAYHEYLNWTEKNLKPGGLVIVDNALLRGAVFEKDKNATFNAKQIESVRQVNARLSDPNRYRGVLIPTAEGMYIAQKI